MRRTAVQTALAVAAAVAGTWAWWRAVASVVAWSMPGRGP